MIAIVDTNVKNFLFNLPIPSNSEGQESISFLMSLISREILLIKYKKLLN
jgi:ribosomal protein S2